MENAGEHQNTLFAYSLAQMSATASHSDLHSLRRCMSASRSSWSVLPKGACDTMFVHGRSYACHVAVLFYRSNAHT